MNLLEKITYHYNETYKYYNQLSDDLLCFQMQYDDIIDYNVSIDEKSGMIILRYTELKI